MVIFDFLNQVNKYAPYINKTMLKYGQFRLGEQGTVFDVRRQAPVRWRNLFYVRRRKSTKRSKRTKFIPISCLLRTTLDRLDEGVMKIFNSFCIATFPYNMPTAVKLSACGYMSFWTTGI
jgi:hypothetical protein